MRGGRGLRPCARCPGREWVIFRRKEAGRCGWRSAPWNPFVERLTDFENYFSKHVAGLDALVGGGGIVEGEGGGDDDFDLPGIDRAVELGKFAEARDGVVGEGFDPFAFSGFGLHAVGVSEASVAFEGVD